VFVTYNGINLALTNLDNVERETIMSDDGTTVLYTEVTLSLSAIYHVPLGNTPHLGGTSVGSPVQIVPKNPSNTSTPPRTVAGSNPGNGGYPQPPTSPSFPPIPGMPGGGGNLQPTFAPQVQTQVVTSGTNPFQPQSQYCNLPNPGASGWRGPIITDRELELFLRTPRQKLIVWAFDTDGTPLTWIESPRGNLQSDAKLGPVVIGCHVRGGPNSNSFFVNMDIRTWITPCEDASDRAILSHRWRMTHNEDENHYLTRQIDGTVVFNATLLVKANIPPDWFRKQFFHPIPLGFKRSLGPITLTEDGTTLKYSYSDTDTSVVFDASDTGATQMEIVEKISYLNPWRGI